MKKECCEEEVQPYRKTDYRPILYMNEREQQYVQVKSQPKMRKMEMWERE